MSDTIDSEDVDQILASLEDLLNQIEDEAPSRRGSSLLPDSIGRLVGQSDPAGLAASANSSVDDLRGILDIDDEYSADGAVNFSGSAQLAASELTDILRNLADQMEDAGAPDELVEAVDTHRQGIEAILDAAKEQTGAEKSPMERAMEEMNSTIEDAEEQDSQTDDGTTGTDEGREGPDVEQELEAIKSQIDDEDDEN